MITRDLIKDIENAEPIGKALSTETITQLRQRSTIWHALWIPPALLVLHRDVATAAGVSPEENPQGAIVWTGHINCHDCLLCVEAGDGRWGGIAVPWRRVYGDCCDDDEVFERHEADDDLAWIPDPLENYRPMDAHLRALRIAVVNPSPGDVGPSGVAIKRAERERVAVVPMNMMHIQAMHVPNKFAQLFDRVAGAPSELLGPAAPDCLAAYREGAKEDPEVVESGVTLARAPVLLHPAPGQPAMNTTVLGGSGGLLK